MTELTTPPGGSPFDAIKRTRPDGTTYWSARDLMPLLGYARWENFEVPLSRAQTSAAAQGYDVETLFLRSQEKGTGRPRTDFQLPRFAAYLVAMNGDPNKPEVAAAQSYFAIRTREAEVRPAPRELTFEEKLQEVMGELTARVEDQRRELESARPKADAYDAFMDADGCYSVGAVAKMLGLGQQRLFDELYGRKVLIATGHLRKTPYQQYMHHFRVTSYTYENSKTGQSGISYTTKVRPSGVDFIRHKLGMASAPMLDVA